MLITTSQFLQNVINLNELDFFFNVLHGELVSVWGDFGAQSVKILMFPRSTSYTLTSFWLFLVQLKNIMKIPPNGSVILLKSRI